MNAPCNLCHAGIYLREVHQFRMPEWLTGLVRIESVFSATTGRTLSAPGVEVARDCPSVVTSRGERVKDEIGRATKPLRRVWDIDSFEMTDSTLFLKLVWKWKEILFDGTYDTCVYKHKSINRIYHLDQDQKVYRKFGFPLFTFTKFLLVHW